MNAIMTNKYRGELARVLKTTLQTDKTVIYLLIA